jgi:hypothetical protein
VLTVASSETSPQRQWRVVRTAGGLTVAKQPGFGVLNSGLLQLGPEVRPPTPARKLIQHLDTPIEKPIAT